MAEGDVREQHPAEDYFVPRSRPVSRLRVYERTAAVAPLALRIPLGIVMAAHGALKLADVRGTSAAFESMGFLPGSLWGPLVGAVELLAGAALLVGLATRVAALAILVVQVVAVLWVHLPHGLFLAQRAGEPNGFEYNLVIIGALVALIFIGSGQAGIDEALRRRRAHRGRAPEVKPAGQAGTAERRGEVEPLKP